MLNIVLSNTRIVLKYLKKGKNKFFINLTLFLLDENKFDVLEVIVNILNNDTF